MSESAYIYVYIYFALLTICKQILTFIYIFFKTMLQMHSQLVYFGVLNVTLFMWEDLWQFTLTTQVLWQYVNLKCMEVSCPEDFLLKNFLPFCNEHVMFNFPVSLVQIVNMRHPCKNKRHISSCLLILIFYVFHKVVKMILKQRINT